MRPLSWILDARSRRLADETEAGTVGGDATWPGTASADADYATALEAGRLAAESEFQAQAVSHRPDRDAIDVITIRNGGFVIPRT